MQIFKSIDFRTMGLWIWITFILIRTVEHPSPGDNLKRFSKFAEEFQNFFLNKYVSELFWTSIFS